MSLQASAAVAARGLEVELDLGAGERVAVLGPNGAGKSTLLAVLAGLLRPDRGRAELDERVLYDVGAGRWRAPHTRGVALLAQDPLLFPHLSVRQNVAFGPRARGRTRTESRAVADHWLREVDAVELADRRPQQLSGGQAQRVAVARALAGEPRLLLLDEPLAALDVGAAPALRRMLRRVLAGQSTILVTHDLLDAWLLADRVLIIEGGRIVESGPTGQVLRHPRTPFAARIAGLNIISGTLAGRTVQGGRGTSITGVLREPIPDGVPVVATFSPSAVSIFVEPPGGSPRTSIAVRITELEPRDDQVQVRAEDAAGQLITADVTAPVVGELDLYPGRAVLFSIKATAVTIYPT